jgi:hypothetical protein
MPITACRLKFATLLVLAASAVLPAVAQLSSGPTSTVVYVGGNDLVVTSADGKLLSFTVAPGTKLSAGGSMVSLDALKPGTKLTAPVPGAAKAVTSVSVVKGKVYVTAPPDAITLVTPQGTKDFVVPAGTTFMVDGKPLGIADVKRDMTVEATVITTGTPGAAPATPPQTGALLIAQATNADDLPAAGTHLPLIGITGLALLVLGFGLMSLRKPVHQA